MTTEAFRAYVDIARKEISSTTGPRLPVLDTYLEKAKNALGVSNKKLKALATECGLCLQNFMMYGAELRKFLRKHRGQIISRHKAKAFTYVKYFLIHL